MIEGEERPARDRRHAPAGVYTYLLDPADTILSSSAHATPGDARGWAVPEPLHMAVTVGFLGAYTTFSTFMSESDTFLRTGLPLRAAAYLFLSLALGLAAVRLGVIAGQRL